MKPQHLSSGNWRVRVYLGKIDGKAKFLSITAKTRAEAQRKAALIVPNANEEMKVGEAAAEYVEIKGPVVSPSTLAGYKKILKNYLNKTDLAVLRLEKVNSVAVQKWISSLAVKKLSPKTVRNAYGFLTAVLNMYAPDLRIHVKLPQRKPQTLYTPTTDDINAVLHVSDPELRKAVLLGATGMMRRGEICALDASDVDFERNLITIRQATVKDADRNYVMKAPKTDSSFRVVEMNQEVIDLLPHEGKVVDLNPDQVTMRFNRAVKKAGVHHFRFHDLRHYAASIAVSSAIGAGALTVQGRGGWSSDNIMKRTYTHAISDQAEKDTGKIIDFFSKNIRFGG